MKSTTILAAALAATTSTTTVVAFSPPPASSSSSSSSSLSWYTTTSSSSSSSNTILRMPPSSSLHATLTADELNGMSKSEQVKLILGVEDEDKIALGIDADEILEFIGTRDDLISKFQTDLPKLTPAEVATEVDKFLMDGEMLDVYIKYTQRKREDPSWEPVYGNQQDANPVAKVVNFFSEYAIYIVGGILVKDFVVSYAEGHGIELPSLPGLSGFGGIGGGGEGGAEVLVSSALDGIQHLTNTLV